MRRSVALCIAAAAIVPFSVGHGSALADHSGTYYVAIGGQPRFTLEITPAGYRLVSLFALMPDPVFVRYRARGVASRDALVITREERDADPLVCEGEQFLDPGHLENWVVLEELPTPRSSSAGRLAPSGLTSR